MKKNTILSSFIFSLLLLSSAAKATNHLVLLGGGGEPSGNTTIFDGDLSALGDNSTFNNWNKTILFNGGHSNTESLLKTKFQGAQKNSTFSRDNYDAFLKETIAKIKSGKIKPGDQMFINILTHGAQREEGKETTHKVALSGGSANNLQTLTGTPTVSLDTLQALIDIADQKGVKLGIANMSCFSGNLQNLNKRSACLISQSIPESFSMSSAESPDPDSFFYKRSGFAKNFFSNIKKGSSLEDAFLVGRRSNRMLDYPLISTPTNEEVNQLLVDRYKEVADITDLLLTGPGTNVPDLPTSDNSNLNALKRQYQNYTCNEIDQLDAFIDNKHFDKLINAMKTKYSDPDVKEFSLAAQHLNHVLKAVQDTKMKFIDIMNEADTIWKKDFPKSAKKFNKFSISSLFYGIEDVLLTDISEEAIIYNKNAPADYKKRVLEIRQAALEVINKLSPEKRAFLSAYPQHVLEFKEEEIKLLSEFQEKSTAVYDRLYRQLKTKEANNCSSFKF